MREGRQLATQPLPLRAVHVPAGASLLASTLFDDPAYAFLLPAPERRQRGLTSFFRRHLATHGPHGCSFVCVAAEDSVEATLTSPVWAMRREPS